MNPVLRRELLRRFRGRRATVVLSLFLLALGLVMLGFHEIGRRALEGQARFLGADVAFLRPALGRFMVESTLATLLGLVLVTAPGFAAGQIAGERERGSLPLLQATLMTPTQIVLGKLWASTAWVGLLVIAALPMVAISTVFGGVELADVVLGIGVVLLVGLCVGAIALGVSARVQRTTAAVVISYAIVLLLVLGTGFLAAVIGVLQGEVEGALFPLYANPFITLAGAVNAATIEGATSLPTPLTPFAYALRANGGEEAFFNADLSRDWTWLWSVLVLVVLALLGLRTAIGRLQVRRPVPFGRLTTPRTPTGGGPGGGGSGGG